MMGAGLGELRTRWESVCHDSGSRDARQRVFDRMILAYSSPDRHYHGLAHIVDCLEEFDTVRDRATNARAVETAIWFHDVIYDGKRTDNEERSADFGDEALTTLGTRDSFRGEVRRLVLATRHDREPAEVDGKLMVDIDLSSLAKPPAQFDENTRLIRQEFLHVPDADFNNGRRQMLARFLARPRIYYTDVFFDRYEQQARQNLERAVARLGG